MESISKDNIMDILSYINFTQLCRVKRVSKYMKYCVDERMNHPNFLMELGKQNIKDEMNKHKINHDKFMKKLNKYHAVISGSFVLKKLLDAPFKYDDIDIYIYDPEYNNNNFYNVKHKDSVSYYHPIEIHIMKNYANEFTTKNSYELVRGIHYTRTYHGSNTKFNIIILNENPEFHIYNRFDMDCCKLYYDGNKIHVFNLLDLVKLKTGVHFNNSVDPEKIYQEKHGLINGIQGNFIFSLIYAKFRILYDIYKRKQDPNYRFKKHIYIEENKLSFNRISFEVESINKPNQITICTNNYFEEYSNYLYFIGKLINLDELFSKNINLEEGIDKDTLGKYIQVCLMIQTFERINKYKNRGIKEFIVDGINDEYLFFSKS